MIQITTPYLPNRKKLDKYIDGIYERAWLTNNGPLVQELTNRLQSYLGVENLLLVSNGTLALQIAYRALGLVKDEQKPEAVTTPFSFVATTSSLQWEGVKPVFADIDSETWCLSPELVDSAVTARTRAIVPVHVYGNACDVEALERIGKQRNIKIIYDGAHAFGVQYKGQSILRHGDASTLSFHATKLFHTGEGGAIVFRKKAHLEKARKLINFGLDGPEAVSEVGINAKMNEFQAALGLCVLDEMDEILEARKQVCETYTKELSNSFRFQKHTPESTRNYAYLPVLFPDEQALKQVQSALHRNQIFPRRYFYPALDALSGNRRALPLPTASDIARRILCLPVSADLDFHAVLAICNIIKKNLEFN